MSSLRYYLTTDGETLNKLGVVAVVGLILCNGIIAIYIVHTIFSMLLL